MMQFTTVCNTCIHASVCGNKYLNLCENYMNAKSTLELPCQLGEIRYHIINANNSIISEIVSEIQLKMHSIRIIMISTVTHRQSSILSISEYNRDTFATYEDAQAEIINRKQGR